MQRGAVLGIGISLPRGGDYDDQYCFGIRVCNMGKQKMRSSDKDTMLFRLLRERRDAEVYMRSIGYRVIYTENSIQKETIFTKDGE